MSYANYGPAYRITSVTNAYVAAPIEAPVVADGAAIVYTNLIRTVGDVEIPLVLAPGVYNVKARAGINIANAASTIIFGQCFLVNTATGSFLGAGQLIAGCSYANGNSVSYVFDFDTFLDLAAETSIALRYGTSGSSEIQVFNAGSTLTSVKLSA